MLFASLSLVPCAATTDTESGDDGEYQPKMAKYKPTKEVRRAHSTPHLDWNLRRRSNRFDPPSSAKTNSYTTSLIVLPTIILCCVGAIIVLFTIALFLRAFVNVFCRCSKFMLNMVYKFFKITKRFKKKYVIDPRKEKRRAKFIFIFAVFATLLSVSFVFKGDVEMDEGVRDIKQGLSYISEVSVGIEGSLGVMQEDAGRISKYLEKNSCPKKVNKYMDDIAVYLDYFYDSVDDAEKVTGSVPRGIDIANNNLQTYAVEQKGFVVFCFFVGVLVLVGLYVVAAFCKNAFLLRLCIVVTEIAVIVLTALCCIEMVLVVSYI